MKESIKDMRKFINDIKTAVNQAEEARQAEKANDQVDAGHDLDSDDPLPMQYLTGVGAVDKATGGGFTQGDSALIVGEEGSGKRMLMMQIAGFLTAEQKLKGMVISTRDNPSGLIPRYLSNMCGIPFGELEHGVKEKNFSPEKWEKIVECKERMKNLKLVKWKFNAKQSIPAAVDHEIKKFEDENGSLDFLILDFIEGTVQAEEPVLAEHLIRVGVNHMVDLARESGKIVIIFSEADSTKAKHRFRLNSSMSTKCGSMGQCVSFVFGLTKHTKESENLSEEPKMCKVQYLFVAKARKVPAKGLIAMQRKTMYQKFDTF